MKLSEAVEIFERCSKTDCSDDCPLDDKRNVTDKCLCGLLGVAEERAKKITLNKPTIAVKIGADR